MRVELHVVEDIVVLVALQAEVAGVHNLLDVVHTNLERLAWGFRGQIRQK